MSVDVDDAYFQDGVREGVTKEHHGTRFREEKM